MQLKPVNKSAWKTCHYSHKVTRHLSSTWTTLVLSVYVPQVIPIYKRKSHPCICSAELKHRESSLTGANTNERSINQAFKLWRKLSLSKIVIVCRETFSCEDRKTKRWAKVTTYICLYSHFCMLRTQYPMQKKADFVNNVQQSCSHSYIVAIYGFLFTPQFFNSMQFSRHYFLLMVPNTGKIDRIKIIKRHLPPFCNTNN